MRGGAVRLEELVVPAGIAAGLEPMLVLVNAQEFTKTANCWGVDNNFKGTNTNRIVLFQKRDRSGPLTSEAPPLNSAHDVEPVRQTSDSPPRGQA